MGLPQFVYYPDVTGTLERVAFGEELQDLQELPRSKVIDSYTGDGVGYRSHMGNTHRVRIILDRFGSPGTSSLERSLLALQAHLFRGGLVGFTRDVDKWWAASLTGIFLPERGDTSISYTVNGLEGWNASADLAVGDELVIESAHPDSLSELAVFDGHTSSTSFDLEDGVIFTYSTQALIRWRDCYPVMWLPEDQLSKPIVFHDHRRSWTLDVTLEYSVAQAMSLWDAGDPELRSTSTGDSLQQLVRGGTI